MDQTLAMRQKEETVNSHPHSTPKYEQSIILIKKGAIFEVIT